MTVADRLAEVRARAEKATKGPWKYPHRDCPGVVMSPRGCLWNPDRGEINDPADAEFIGHAREDVPRLVAFAEAVLELADEWASARTDSNYASDHIAVNYEREHGEILHHLLGDYLSGGDR